jgi:hypothetical protein
VFWRCFASTFIRRRKDMLDALLMTLVERGIEPIGSEGAPRSVHTEHRRVSLFAEPALEQDRCAPVGVLENSHASKPAAQPAGDSSARVDPPPVEAQQPVSTGDGKLFNRKRVLVFPVRAQVANLPFSNYVEYTGPPGKDPYSVNMQFLSESIVRIIEVEGPVIAKRVYDIYLRGCGNKRMGHELKSTLNKALTHAIGQGGIVHEDEAGKGDLVFYVVRVKGSPPIRLRSRGPRSFEEIPPSEVQVVAKYLLEQHGFTPGSDEHLRAILDCFDLRRLTTQVGATMLDILGRGYPHVDEFLSHLPKYHPA